MKNPKTYFINKINYKLKATSNTLLWVNCTSHSYIHISLSFICLFYFILFFGVLLVVARKNNLFKIGNFVDSYETFIQANLCSFACIPIKTVYLHKLAIVLPPKRYMIGVLQGATNEIPNSYW